MNASLSDSGAIIIKFFLHISKEEQKMRLLERERNPLTAWLVTPRIWDFHHHYETYLPIIDEFIEHTDTAYAPWHVIEATDRKYTILKVYSYLVKTLEKTLEKRVCCTIGRTIGKRKIQDSCQFPENYRPEKIFGWFVPFQRRMPEDP